MKILVVLLTSCLSWSYAQTTITPSNTSTSEGQFNDALKKLRPDRISYFSIFAGPSLGGDGDPVDEFGEVQEGDVSTWNQVSFQWQLTKKTRMVVNPRFVLNHNQRGPDAQALELDDPVVGITSTWYETENFTFGGGLNTIVPGFLTEDTKEDGLILNPGGFQDMTYTVNDKLSVGGWIWGRTRIYDRSLEADDDLFSFFVAPKVGYSLTENLGVTGFYQVNGDIKNGWSTVIDTNDTMNVMLSYRINRYISLEPMITLYRESDFQVSKANFNMWLYGRLF